MGEDFLYFNGIDGEVGDYDLPPMTGEELSSFIQGVQPPENLKELRFRHYQDTNKSLGVMEGIDPLDLAESGWGVIFAHDADPALQEALQDLIDLRREQAGDKFKIFAGVDGYRPGESKTAFLARHGAGPGPVDPAKVPYYLLIAGSPERIPFQFQTLLDVQYAVGRLHFDSLEAYASYARSVVATERGEARLPRRAAFFGVANEGDRATQMSAAHLVSPLQAKILDSLKVWEADLYTGIQADKSELARLLGGDKTPAFLFTASHGMRFPINSSRLIPHQGALLCQDWPGPEAWRGQGPIPQDFYFAGDDLPAEGQLLGLVAFFFACFGAGTPRMDQFSRQAFRRRAAMAPYPFVAQLPAKMLGHPSGGALAVIGHIERAWGFSFLWRNAGAQTAVFQSCLQRLFAGHPVGSACEYFDQRYAELSTVLADELEEIEFGKPVDPYELAGLWTANNDARNYTILGDPAVRLPAAHLA